MEKKGLTQANTLRSNNTTSTGYGIVYADEIIGSRSVKTKEDLNKLPDWVLGKDNKLEKGTTYYVENEKCFYIYTGDGWQKSFKSIGLPVKSWYAYDNDITGTAATSQILDISKIIKGDDLYVGTLDGIEEQPHPFATIVVYNDEVNKVPIAYITLFESSDPDNPENNTVVASAKVFGSINNNTFPRTPDFNNINYYEGSCRPLDTGSLITTWRQTGGNSITNKVWELNDFSIKGNTIKISEIDFTTDTLQKFNDSISSGDHVIKTQYSVVDNTYNNIVGQMLLIGDSMGHMVTEILTTSATLKNGVIDWDAHSDTEVNTYIRRNHVKEGGTSSIAVGSWSKWTYYSGEGQYNDFKILVAGELSKKVNTSDVVQQTGDSTTSVMSQKAVSHELANLPDEEDLTFVKESERNVLKLADRSYAPEKFSGKGYKILRKNIIDGKNVLTQDMINEPNTIYEIRYDFDLNGQEIIVPDNCVLKFEGGYLKNGTLSGELCFSGDYIDVLRDISLQKIKNVAVIDYRYIFSNSLNNIFVVKNNKDLTKAINAYNSASDEQYWVITNTIVTDEITLTGIANLTIIGCNNAELIYATSVYSVKKSDNILDCIHNSYKLSNYDLFHDDFSRILFSGEKDVYSEDVDMQVYEYNDGIYSSLGSSINLYSTITNDNNRYAGFKLSDMLLNKLFGTTALSECNLSVEKCVNIKLDYVTGYWNYRTGIHSIDNGYVYFKNTNLTAHDWYTYNGDAFYHVPMRYSIINCILLKDSETVTVDENNTLYAPMSSVNLYRTDEETSLFNIAKGSTVDILNLTIKYAYYAVNTKRTVHIKNCKFLNNFIALYLDGATDSTIKSNKFLNSYASASQIKYSDNTSFIFNEVKNSGLIDRNRRYAVNFSYSNNGLIAYNSFVNFYTAIGLTAGREHLENKYNCVAICYNKLCIEEDYVNNLNSITDYGVIYLAPFQKGTCSINGVIYNRSKIHANIICNSCGSYKGRGIYLDDGAYNTSVTENYVIGLGLGIYMRTVTSASNPYNNTNNEISYNIVVNGAYNVGKPAGGDDNWNINYNFIVTNSPYYSTFTNLSAIEENKFLIVRFFSIKENVLYIPITLFYHLFYNAKVDWFISKNIAETNIGSSLAIKESAIMSTRAKSAVPANSKYLKISIQGVTTNNLMYDITIITYFSVLKLTELSYDPTYKQFRYVTNLNGDTFKAFYHKYDEENQILQLLIESNKTNAFDTLKVLALSYFSGTLQPSSSAETTSISYVNGKLAYPCSMLTTYYEGLDDVNISEWTEGYCIDKYSSENRFMKSNTCLAKNGDLLLTIDAYNQKAPSLPYIFNSVSDATYAGRKFNKAFYYKDKALIQGYAIDEDKTQYKEYDLLGKPILSESGTFENKPTVEQGVGIGFAYFCTNKQTEEGTTNGIMIYHKGSDVWVDALGRVVS